MSPTVAFTFLCQVLVPTLQDALTSAMEEVKGGDSKEVEVKMDKIIFDRKETQPDYFKTQEEDCGPASSEFGNPWTVRFLDSPDLNFRFAGVPCVFDPRWQRQRVRTLLPPRLRGLAALHASAGAAQQGA